MNYSSDYLNSLDFPNFPLHSLELKTGCFVMLLKNLDVSSGLVNGTRLKILKCFTNFLQCEILNGTFKGDVANLIPVDEIYENKELGLKFKRTQIPVRLCFSITINKSQGQTLDFCALYLKSNIFAHGQLYVAMSRVKRG
jgi:ATP-dependent DNA helicase PIF1